MIRPIRVLAATSLLALTACATTPIGTDSFGVVSVLHQKGEQGGLAVTDARSDTQRTTRSEPLGSSLALYLGDDRIQPSPPTLLGDRLGRHRGALPSTEGIRLMEFEVRIVDPLWKPIDSERLRNTALSMGPMGLAAAPVAGALISAIENARRQLTLRSVIEIDFGEQRYRAVAYQSLYNVSEVEIAAVIEAALTDLDAQLAEAAKSKP